MLLIYTPEHITKPSGFLMVSGGIDEQQRAVQGSTVTKILPYVITYVCQKFGVCDKRG